MCQQAFCIHFKDVKGEGSRDCTHNRVNVFERGILQPGHSAVSLTTVPHCTDCSCAQCEWAQAASNLVMQVTIMSCAMAPVGHYMKVILIMSACYGSFSTVWSLPIVEGTVGSILVRLFWAHDIFSSMSVLLGSTWWANFRFPSVYSCPQNTRWKIYRKNLS